MPVRILVHHRASASANPYTRLLIQGLREQGHVVDQYCARHAHRRYDVVHLHWPERYAPPWRSVGDVASTLVAISGFALQWMRGARLVWTAHNIGSHEGAGSLLERQWLRLVARMCHGVIALSEASVDAVRAAHPELGGTPLTVIPHGHYRDVYGQPVDRAAARTSLDLDPDGDVVLQFGRMRGYKGLDAGAAAARALGSDLTLVVAGPVDDPGVLRPLRTLDQRRVRLIPGVVPDAQVPTLFGAANLVLLPYRRVLNSGVAMLALSLGVPVLAPATGSLPELADHVGPAWMRTFEADLTTQVLGDALAWARPTRHGLPDLAAFDWATVAAAHADFFNSLRRSRRTGAPTLEAPHGTAA